LGTDFYLFPFFVRRKTDKVYIRSAKITKHMDHALLEKYRRLFGDLNPNKAKGRISPHKPVLILTVTELITEGKITSNRIDINDRFLKELFSDYWIQFAQPGDEFNFIMPFFHLRTSSFWKLIPHRGKEQELREAESIKSLKRINELVQYAELAPDLFGLLQNRSIAEQLMEAVMETYFPDGEQLHLSAEDDLLASDSKLITGWQLPIRQKTIETKEQLVLLRNAAFRKLLLREYGYRCAISEINAISSKSKQRLVDACHIIPFAESTAETLANGIVLTPTLHQAFDTGFITVDKHYRVNVSSTLKEQESSYMLRQFEGKQILLPSSREHYPSMKSLEWHWENRFIH
jgi:putative restriction endonuclease